MRLSYSKTRDSLLQAGLWPVGRLARIACYLAAFAAALSVLKNLLALFVPEWGAHLGGWITFLGIVSAVLFSILGFRWLRRRILWRLRNRLIVTYVFIGVIPVLLLLTMGFITIYLFAGQFSGFVVTTELNSQLRSVEAVNAAISNELAARVERGDNPAAESLAGLKKRNRAWRRRQVCAWYGVKPISLSAENAPAFSYPDFFNNKENSYAKEIAQGEPFRGIVRDGDQLYLRVASVLTIRGNPLTVVTSEPLDRDLLQKIADDLGEITLYASGIRLIGEDEPQTESGIGNSSVNLKAPTPPSAAGAPDKQRGTLIIRQEGISGKHVQSNQQVLVPTFTVGTLPAAASSVDREIQFGTPLQIIDWKTGADEKAGAVVRVRTLPSVLYDRLFASLGEIATGVEYILLAVGIFFAIIELVALFTGTRMTRTVTRSVAELYDATRHVDTGDFSHRIPVKSRDQLSELALSFNSMTESIEKLVLEQKEKQRMENELVIAQEVQAQLYPRQITELESLEVHGFCRPARTVSGDYYDFLTAGSHNLILAVGDISGKGISAALLMATIHSAVRAYSVESLPQVREISAVGVAGGGRIMSTSSWPEGLEISPATLLRLLNHQLFESTPPEKYATLFLGIYDGPSHRLTYSNGGHLPPLLISEDGALRRLESGGTVVGLFDDMTYDEGCIEMQPGEIFVAYSDGVTEPENEFGEFGEERLIDLVRENRHLPLPQISQMVTAAVEMWIGDNEQPDDVTVVLARAR